ncbi:ubiquitin carboxyl-terminal hydrolase 38-like [Watersipora subatra]|uniref:ubiquitin carboxyl-terminal hydrolase 38-like n=1 Tax=Watersipora subatra TaxID=2589382 RepID=UPI00355BAE46
MDAIFRGLMSATTLDTDKKLKTLRMIEKSGNHPHTHEEVRALILATVPYWLNSGTSVENMEMAKSLFVAWANNNIDTMIETLTTELIMMINSTGEQLEIVSLCDLVSSSLSILESVGDVSSNTPLSEKLNDIVSFFSSDIVHILIRRAGEETNKLSVIADFIDRHPQISPLQNISALLKMLIEQLSKSFIDVNVMNPHDFIHQVNQIKRLIKNIWQKSKTPKLHILKSLQHLFNIISSTPEIDDVSVALSSVLQSVPVAMMEDVCSNLLKDSQISNTQISNALTHMVSWLQWPKHATIHEWILKIARGLAEDGRGILLLAIVDKSCVSVVRKLHCQQIRFSTLRVLTVFLLYQQKCPQAFHSCIPTILELVETVQDDKLFSQLSELVQILMYVHPGYPELYNALLSKFGDAEPLQESYIQNVLKTYFIADVSHSFSTLSNSSHLVRKGEKVGLENLGNTCFLNAVLQALYSIDTLQTTLLSNGLSQGNLLQHLQRVFASLHLTQRAAVDPSEYIKVGWPSWFIQGHQQDSSEYLRFLLDNIHEESKRLPDHGDVTRYFTGSDTVVTRCHRCGKETQTHQKFYDISLHFAEERPAQERVHLETLLEDYAGKPEELAGANQFSCDACGLQDATRSLLDCSLPTCLVLTLCRFSYNHKLAKNVKLKTPVCYPDVLELKGEAYKLNAVIVHSGTSLNGGHYYTYARSLRENRQWYLFNDIRVTPCVSPSQLAIESSSVRLSCDTPYILFYTVDSPHDKMAESTDVSSMLRYYVEEDNLQLLRDLKMADQKKKAKKQAGQVDSRSWYSYAGDEDDDHMPPSANSSLDLSGSRFIY